jgi:small-conductance mechanosensitive channel
MTQIIIIVAAACLAWLGLAWLNHRLYNFAFQSNDDRNIQRDLIVLLGPVGTIMLGIFAAFIGYENLANGLGKRWSKASNFALLFAVFIPWVGSGAANYVWYGRVFDDCDYEENMQRDLIVALGPIGSVMLFLCWLTALTLKVSGTARSAR